MRDIFQNVSVARKNKLYLSTILLIIGFWCIFPILSANDSSITKESDDLLFGTWVSEEYDRTGFYNAKWVINSDGTEFNYHKIADTKPAEEVRNEIEQKWIDSGGWYLYKIRSVFWAFPNGAKTTVFLLIKIDPTGTKMESVVGSRAYPEEISTIGSFYRIMNKKP